MAGVAGNVCSDQMCFCEKFVNADSLELTKHQSVLDQMDKVKEKIAYMLENIPELRNLSNKAFVFCYYHYNNGFCTGMVLTGKKYYELSDPEIIRRTKQKLVEKEPEKYAPTDELVDKGKGIKYGGILEWVRTE
jgi:hypothetical protein